MKIHIVQQGDTLWKLAKKYDVDFEQLKAVNNHLSNPDVIMPGMKIKIPTGGVPVKKQTIKKEQPVQVKEQPIQVKEQPIQMKEQPKAKEMPLPKKEEVKVPEEIKKPEPIIQQPIAQPPQQPITQEQYLQNMNMNFNIYKPVPPPKQPKVPEPPKMPVKETPKVEKPKPMVPPPPEPPKKEMPMPSMPIQQPIAQPAPMQPQGCYPVSGIMPGCSYNMPPVVQPYQAQPFQPYQQQPMMPPTQAYGYPQGSCGTPAPMPYVQGYPAMPMQGYQQPPLQQMQPPMQPMPYNVPQMQQPWPQNANLDDLDDLDNEFFAEQPLPNVPPTGVPYTGAQMPPMQMPAGYSGNWGQPHNAPMYGAVPMQQSIPQQASPWGYPQHPNQIPMYQQPQPQPFNTAGAQPPRKDQKEE